MFEKISERSEMLDNGIEEFAEGFREMYGIGELGDPGSFSEVSERRSSLDQQFTRRLDYVLKEEKVRRGLGGLLINRKPFFRFAP